jgi:hypothetical protein
MDYINRVLCGHRAFFVLNVIMFLQKRTLKHSNFKLIIFLYKLVFYSIILKYFRKTINDVILVWIFLYLFSS